MSCSRTQHSASGESQTSKPSIPSLTLYQQLNCNILWVIWILLLSSIKPNKKKISVFRVTGLNILGRIGTHIFFTYFSGKNYNFMHFERPFAFQNA